jgi:hypothetical protein
LIVIWMPSSRQPSFSTLKARWKLWKPWNFEVHDVGCGRMLAQKNVVGRIILKRELGDDCFDDDGDSVGHFWLILPTRPYMRVLQSLVKVYHDAGKIEDSA